MTNHTPEIREIAEEMLHELENSHFEVVLVPPMYPMNPGGMLRALQSGNPRWYSEFCASYKSCRGRGRKRMRRARTFIKKEEAVKALNKIIDGKTKGIYCERLLEFIKRKLEKSTETAETDAPIWLDVPDTRKKEFWENREKERARLQK